MKMFNERKKVWKQPRCDAAKKQIYTSIRRGVAKHKFLDALFVVVKSSLSFVRMKDKQYSTHDRCFFLWPFKVILANETAENYLLIIL